MSTTLASQLKQLQIPGLEKDVTGLHHVSILFDEKTAAALDIESVYNVGISGYDQMVTIEPALLNYKDQLFSNQVIHCQRVMQDKSFNKKLQQTISEFLLLLSPYLQLQAAKKCLEWLLRRFEIHRFDCDSLMCSILPYHETQLFAKIIELVDNDHHGTLWEHLIPTLKLGSVLSTRTLIRHCHENYSLLNFVYGMAVKSVKLLQKTPTPSSNMEMMFSFYARIICGVVTESPSSVPEALISNLLPMIDYGLTSKVKHLINATYMIITVLISNAVFKEKARNSFIIHVIKSMQPDWYEMGIMCVLSIAHSSKMLSLPKKSFTPIMNQNPKDLVYQLEKMQTKYNISVLVELVLELLCENFHQGKPDLVGQFIEELVNTLQFSVDAIKFASRSLIDAFVAHDSEETSQTELIRLNKLFAVRFTEVFDGCIGEKFTEFKEDKSGLEKLKVLTNNCLVQARNQIIESTELPLVVCLHHPESQLRCQAVKEIFELYQSGVHGDSDEFFKESILQRMQDDDTEVVKEVLKHPKAILKILNKEEITNILSYLSKRADDSFNLSPLYMKVLKDLDSSKNDEQEIFFSVLSQVFTFMSSRKSRSIIRFFQDDDYPLDHPILSGIKKTLSSVTKLKEESKILKAYQDLIYNVAERFEWELFTSLWDYQEKLHQDHILKFLSYLILMINLETKVFAYEKVIELKIGERVTVVGQAEDFLNEDPLPHMFSLFFNGMKEDKKFQSSLTSMCYCYILKILIQILSENVEDEKLRKKLYKCIVPNACGYGGKSKSHLKVYQNLSKEFFKGCFKDEDEVRDFLTDQCIFILLDDHKVHERHLKLSLTCLSLLNIFLNTKEAIEISEKEIGLHVALLSYPNRMVRINVMKNMELYHEIKMKEKKNPWNFILKATMASKSEILMDSSYAERLFDSLLNLKSGIKSHNEFEMLSGKDSGDTKKKSAVIDQIMKCFKIWPVAITAEILRLLKFYVITDDTLDGIDVATIHAEYKRTGERFHQQIITHIIDKNKTISHKAVDYIVRCLALDSWKIEALILQKLSNSFYLRLEEENQLEILKALFQRVKLSKSVKNTSSIRIALKELHIKTTHICHILHDFAAQVDTVISKTDDTSERETILKDTIAKTEELLLAVNGQNIDSKENDLVISMFSTLERCMKLRGVEFLKQLCLTFLHQITIKEKVSLNFHNFKVETILQCLRTSDNLQTQENCLLLIGSTAALFPVQILHSVMHVFTFMGGSLLRLDNEHSFTVIQKTIHTILPAVLQIEKKGGRKRIAESSITEIVLDIIQTFVDSCPHCPEHRREFILQELLKAVGIQDHLFNTMLLLIKQISTEADIKSGVPLTAADVDMESTEANYSPITLDFCLHFFSLYDIHLQLSTIHQMIHFLSNLSLHGETKKKKKQPSLVTMVFNTEKEGEKKTRLFVYTVVSFVTLSLKSQSNQFKSVTEDEEKVVTSIFMQLTESLIHYIDMLDGFSKDSPKGSLNQRFYEKLLEKICRVLDTTLQTVPFTTYVSILAGLLQKNQLVLKRQALELLGKLLQDTTEHLSSDQETSLLAVFPILSTILTTSLKKKSSLDADITQVVLFCLRLLVVKLCQNFPDIFLPIAPVMIQLYKRKDVDDMVLVNAMLLAAELVAHLKVQLLPNIDDLVQPIFSQLSSSIVDNEKKESLIVITCVSSLHKMFVSLPEFMSPYVSSTIQKVAEIHKICPDLKDAETLDRIIGKLRMIIAEKTSARILLPVLIDLTLSVTPNNVELLSTVTDISSVCFDKMSSKDINDAFCSKIFSFFKTLLEKPSLITHSTMESLEEQVIVAFCKLTLRMTEKSVHTAYNELFNWANGTKQMVSRKTVTFYRLSNHLAATLQGLFLLFAHDTVEKSAEILSQLANAGSSDDLPYSQEILSCVVDCCAAIFRYDTHGFVNRDRFQLVVEPIIEQIETNVFEDDLYKSFVKEHLQPCIVNLASAVNDENCWKTLNHQLLLKTKSDKPTVRLAVLEVIEKIYDKLGESYMVLIPETIPFLSEVLEDESSEVEEKCRQVIKQIEQITGESIQKYF